MYPPPSPPAPVLFSTATQDSLERFVQLNSAFSLLFLCFCVCFPRPTLLQGRQSSFQRFAATLRGSLGRKKKGNSSSDLLYADRRLQKKTKKGGKKVQRGLDLCE